MELVTLVFFCATYLGFRVLSFPRLCYRKLCQHSLLRSSEGSGIERQQVFAQPPEEIFIFLTLPTVS